MHRSQSTSRSRRGRRATAAVAFGVVLGLSPVWPTTLEAQAPSISVTGLARGARGDEVRALQQALVSQGVTLAGGVDGIFGPGTETALKSFQASKGLPATGVVDEASAIALGLSSSPFLGLTQGNTGDAVRQLQQRLIDAGNRPAGGADGVFGSATSAALAAFQTAKGLPATGTVDAATAAALGQSAPAAASQPASQPAASQPAASQPAASQPAADPSGGAGTLVGLKIGARGEPVATLQRAIMAAGFTVVGGADGVFGVLTANALRSFQNANGLGVTGVVDDATAALLARVSGGGAHDPTVTASPLLGLRYGSIGADVTALQQALIGAGIRPRGGADGVFGAATAAALKQYQAARGLTPSGVVDEATANALASTGGGGQANPLVGLKAGSLGNTVKQLQETLIAAGINVRGGADGIFGPATQNALRDFQRSQGLPETGVVDDATAAALANPKTPVGDPGEGGGFAEFGEKGERVVALQSALVNAGIALRGGVDGSFGGGTAAAVMDFQRLRGLAVTGKVDAATGAALGLTGAAPPAAPDPTSVTLAAFPVQGRCYFGDSWGYPRSGGRVHLGVDIIASPDKLIYAVAEGRITKVYQDYPGSLAGNGVRLTTADGTYFFYAHMSRIADGIDLGVPVKAGQIIGYIGRTGNAGTDHLHFEVHPKGGAAVNPYPIVKAIDGCGNTEPLPQP
jgi:peptidoglycan hydrolase-like protein with peptidoglycan-binding domain